MWHIWLIISGLFFVLEMITVGFLMFWLAIGALFAMIVSFFTTNIIIQTAVFVISSAILIFFTKPLVDKFISKKDSVATNAFSVIGKIATVTQDINSDSGSGQVKVSGEIWSAYSEDSTVIKAGTKVEITSIQGVKVCVKPTYTSKISNI